MDEMEDLSGRVMEEALPAFIESSEFKGIKLNYVFKRGQEGIGYYFDNDYSKIFNPKQKSDDQIQNISHDEKESTHTKTVTVDIEKTLQTLCAHMKNNKLEY